VVEMTTTQTRHLPYRFVNVHQRCSRCGTVLEIEEKTAQDTHFWVCRNDDGSAAEFVGPAAAFLSQHRPCEENQWVDEMGHVAGPAARGKQSCSRCGEDLTWIFPKEPLPTGTEYTITIEAAPGEYVRHSARLHIAPDTPLCTSLRR
jgi:ribosomal protein S14